MSPDAVTIHDLKGDANPYAYVHGSPLMGVDPDGNFAQMAIGAIVGAVVSTVTQLAVNGSVDWKEVAISAAVGAITGGVGSLLGSGIMAGAASGMIGNAANSILHGESISAKGLATGALSGGVSGGISGAGGANPNAATSIGLGSVGSAASYVAVSGATGQRVSASGLGMAVGSGGFSSAVSVGVGAAYSAIKLAGQAERVAVGSGKAAAQKGGADAAFAQKDAQLRQLVAAIRAERSGGMLAENTGAEGAGGTSGGGGAGGTGGGGGGSLDHTRTVSDAGGGGASGASPSAGTSAEPGGGPANPPARDGGSRRWHQCRRGAVLLGRRRRLGNWVIQWARWIRNLPYGGPHHGHWRLLRRRCQCYRVLEPGSFRRNKLRSKGGGSRCRSRSVGKRTWLRRDWFTRTPGWGVGRADGEPYVAYSPRSDRLHENNSPF